MRLDDKELDAALREVFAEGFKFGCDDPKDKLMAFEDRAQDAIAHFRASVRPLVKEKPQQPSIFEKAKP
jgi:hypothetical protein